MKKLIIPGIAFYLFFFMSCTDPCEGVSCNDRGFCEEGTCFCDNGYEGTNCVSETRTKYFGTYAGLLNCTQTSSIDETILIRSSGLAHDIIEFTDPDLMGVIYVAKLGGNAAIVPNFEVILQSGTKLIISTKLTFVSTDEFLYEQIQTNDLGAQNVCTGTMFRQ